VSGSREVTGTGGTRKRTSRKQASVQEIEQSPEAVSLTRQGDVVHPREPARAQPGVGRQLCAQRDRRGAGSRRIRIEGARSRAGTARGEREPVRTAGY